MASLVSVIEIKQNFRAVLCSSFASYLQWLLSWKNWTQFLRQETANFKAKNINFNWIASAILHLKMSADIVPLKLASAILYAAYKKANYLISNIEGSSRRLHAHGIGALCEVKTLQNLPDSTVDQGHRPILAGRN